MDVFFTSATLASLAIGYFFGSIPFGLIITRLAGAGDLRSIGSGNIGATNVLRTGNKGLAALTLLGDALKGVVPIWLLASTPEAAIVMAFGAFMGHLYPVWLRFRGGKGIATYVGLTLAFSYAALMAFAAVWLTTAFFTRYSSLAALLATLIVPAVFWFVDLPRVAILFALLTLIAWWKHRENISRLLSGSESRIGAKSG